MYHLFSKNAWSARWYDTKITKNSFVFDDKKMTLRYIVPEWEIQYKTKTTMNSMGVSDRLAGNLEFCERIAEAINENANLSPSDIAESLTREEETLHALEWALMNEFSSSPLYQQQFSSSRIEGNMHEGDSLLFQGMQVDEEEKKISREEFRQMIKTGRVDIEGLLDTIYEDN